jgi:hypothetical protein
VLPQQVRTSTGLDGRAQLCHGAAARQLPARWKGCLPEKATGTLARQRRSTKHMRWTGTHIVQGQLEAASCLPIVSPGRTAPAFSPA